jgi:hypothetical protein
VNAALDIALVDIGLWGLALIGAGVKLAPAILPQLRIQAPKEPKKEGE